MNYHPFALVIIFSIFSLAHGEHDDKKVQSRPLAAEQKELFRGATDINVKESDGPGSLCQSTFVSRNQLASDPQKCRVAFLTAAHCVDSSFEAIEFSGFGEVKRNELVLCRPREYLRNKARIWRDNSSVAGDLATLVFDIPCDKTKNEPALLAPIAPDGITLLETPHLFLQKRTSAAPGNPGGAKRIQADFKRLEKKLYTFHAPSPQGAAIVGGDSGGPVFDEKGRLVCPMIASSYEYLRMTEKLKEKEPDGKSETKADPFEVTCDSRAIGKLKEYFSSLGLSPDSSVPVSKNASEQKHPDCAQLKM